MFEKKSSMHKLWFYIFLIFVFTACTSSGSKEKLKINEIVEKAIDSSGTQKFNESLVEFQFRDKVYRSIPTCNGLKLQRNFKEDTLKIEDEFYQGEFKRIINGKKINVQDSLAYLYSESINSVHYFVQLPFRLKDEAVQLALKGIESQNQKSYYKLKVTFQQEGGGEDFEDVYYYWINTETFRIAYLAYSFQVNGGGIRFRKASRRHQIDGIEFIDYENYKPKLEGLNVENAFIDYFSEKYSLLSTIENRSIKVKRVQLDCDH